MGNINNKLITDLKKLVSELLKKLKEETSENDEI